MSVPALVMCSPFHGQVRCRQPMSIGEGSRPEFGIRSIHHAISMRGYVSRHEDCRKAGEACVESFGRIAVMAAHTGIAEPIPFLEIADEHWHRHMAINVDGSMCCTLEAARAMLTREHLGRLS